MSGLHVHGQVTPTSRVVRNRHTLKSPLQQSLTPNLTKRKPATAPASSSLESCIVAQQLPVEAPDFSGLDVLSAIDYLKRLQTDLPPRLSRDARTSLLNRRRDLPLIVLGHQITSLFPNLPTLERDLCALVKDGRIVEIILHDGERAYLRRNDYQCPPSILQGPITDLSDAQFREFSQAGWLLRRHGTVTLSAPNSGAYFSALRAARKHVLGQLRAGIALQKDVKARYENWKDGGIFQFENLLHDLVGSCRIEILKLTVGRALRITKRGRETA